MRIPGHYSAGIRHDNFMNTIRKGALAQTKSYIRWMGEGINEEFRKAQDTNGFGTRGVLKIEVEQEFAHNFGHPWVYRVTHPFNNYESVKQAKIPGSFQHGIVQYLCFKSPAFHGKCALLCKCCALRAVDVAGIYFWLVG